MRLSPAEFHEDMWWPVAGGGPYPHPVLLGRGGWGGLEEFNNNSWRPLFGSELPAVSAVDRYGTRQIFVRYGCRELMFQNYDGALKVRWRCCDRDAEWCGAVPWPANSRECKLVADFIGIGSVEASS